jgi:hypothetical protein
MLFAMDILQQRPANAPMEVVNPADVPEYEVNAKELGNFKRDPKLPEVIFDFLFQVSLIVVFYLCFMELYGQY